MDIIDIAIAKKIAGGGGSGNYPPSGGVPKTDLASDVQASLGKADTALQENHEAVTYAELVDLCNNGQLTPGKKYRITDFVTTVNGTYDLTDVVGQSAYVHYARSAGHPFDLIVTAISAYALDEHATAAFHSGNDEYFAHSALEQWDIHYTIENDAGKYAWADATNGKGVITYMKDEFGNEAGYDFKNVQFLVYQLKADVPDVLVSNGQFGSVFHVYIALSNYLTSGSYSSPFSDNIHDFDCGALILNTIGYPTVDNTYLSTFKAKWCYTFNLIYDLYDYDLSLNHSLDGNYHQTWHCVNNKIAPSGDPWALWSGMANIPFGLGAIVFENYDTQDQINCSNNTIGANCTYNIFGHNCFNNNLDYNCYGNIFGAECDDNTLGSFCFQNILYGTCHDNVFGSACAYNIFGYGCRDNTLTYNCASNTLATDCRKTFIIDNSFQNVSGHAGILYIADDSNNTTQTWNPADLAGLISANGVNF